MGRESELNSKYKVTEKGYINLIFSSLLLYTPKYSLLLMREIKTTDGEQISIDNNRETHITKEKLNRQL